MIAQFWEGTGGGRVQCLSLAAVSACTASGGLALQTASSTVYLSKFWGGSGLFLLGFFYPKKTPKSLDSRILTL